MSGSVPDTAVHQSNSRHHQGYELYPSFATHDECARILGTIEAYRAHHRPRRIIRPARERALDYSVIDGIEIRVHLPVLSELQERVKNVAEDFASGPLEPLHERVAVNVNIVGRGGEYRWHYDRNAVTALLYLNRVSGGEVEMYPNYRLHLGRFVQSSMQQRLDAVLKLPVVRATFARRVSLAPSPGALLVMNGSRSLHSVAPVLSAEERINIIFAFDKPGARANETTLDEYLYEEGPREFQSDPNYGNSRRPRRHPA